jgi:hypothetical protein
MSSNVREMPLAEISVSTSQIARFCHSHDRFRINLSFGLAPKLRKSQFMGHASQNFWPLLNGGTDAILYCFLWLYFSVVGAGPWSLDAKLPKVNR